MSFVNFRAGLAGLSPAYFGMVMATGIVSIAAHLLGLAWLARGLYLLNCAFYAALWALYLLRLWWHPRAFFQDLFDHLRGPGYFTSIAASGVLGSQTVVLYGWLSAAFALWCVAIALWLGFTYAIFTILTVKEAKPPLDRGINGGWLLAVVATSRSPCSARCSPHASGSPTSSS